MDISEKLGQQIRTLRLQKGLSQAKLAKLLGVHPTYISSVERGMRNLTVKSVEKIAKAINIPIEKFLKIKKFLKKNYYIYIFFVIFVFT
jgi:transcriptional regulator with XRE-family HTH domain